MLNKIQLDQIRYNAENGTATSKDCLELLDHMQESGMLESSIMEKIAQNIDSFIDVKIDHFIKFDEKGFAEFVRKNTGG